VVVCGGEPTLDPGLPDLVEALFGLGLAVKVDTNGMRPEVVAGILSRCPQTLFAVDVKGPWEKYPGLTGQAVSGPDARDRLKAVFHLASTNPGSFDFRITVVPGLTPHDVRVAGGYLPAGFTLKEQPFVPPVYGKETPHAPADSETRRLPGNLVPGPDRTCHTEGP
jgi:pyruvate formate lyase activating enzyme